MAGKLLYKREVYELQGHLFAVRNKLGAGWSEHIYHQALVRSLKDAGIPFISKPRKSLQYRNEVVHIFEPDLIVWDRIVLELKALPYQITFLSEHIAQLLHYLKFFEKPLGLLINMAPAKVRTRRVLWTEPSLDVQDNLIESSVYAEHRPWIDPIKSSIVSIGKQFGLGYSDSIYRRLVAIELRHQGLAVQSNIEVPAQWEQRVLAYHRTPVFLIESRCLLHITALANRNTRYDFHRMISYLDSLGLPCGLLVNFGFRQLQINLITPH